MCLAMYFYHSKTKIHLDKVNGVEDGWEYFEENTEDVHYLYKFYDLHDFIISLYKENNLEDFEKYGGTGTVIELTAEMLEKLEDWIWKNNEGLDDLYRIVCEMIFRTKHGEFFYYEGDY